MKIIQIWILRIHIVETEPILMKTERKRDPFQGND